MRMRAVGVAALALLVGWTAGPTVGQPRVHEQGLPDPVPPPLPPKQPKKPGGGFEPLLPALEGVPWKLDAAILEPLHEKAAVYQAYTRRFTCRETARTADYDGGGSVKDERERTYGYLLVTSAAGNDFREVRQEIARDGSIKPREVVDEEPFPPAYAWVRLFSRFNEPYFDFRYIEDRFDGFDWVHEIHFRGTLPFTDGKDIRQWEGRALVDAVTYTPLEIRAEPLGQHERLEALYRRWARSFNLIGLKTGPKPLAYRAHIEFRLRREGLTFPTELRYDTHRAVGLHQVVPTRASSRTYTDYRITRVTEREEIGEAVDEDEQL